MLEKARRLDGLHTVCTDALSFSRRLDVPPYDVALLKEVVHHIGSADVARLYAGVYRQLAPGGVALTVTRPRVLAPDFPLFDACRPVWRDNQDDVETYASAMRDAGFERLNVHSSVYEFRVLKAKWLDMIRSRFWSTLAAAHFSDDELAEGVNELERRFAGEDEVVVRDQLIFLVGRKAPDGRFVYPACSETNLDADRASIRW